MAWSNIGGGGENVKPEVDIQTPLIEDIKESLVGKATGANATADTILEGYSAYVGQELVEGKYKPHGLYVWRKYEYESSTVGDFVDYVVSDTETDYPDGDVQDGHWYKKVVEGVDFGTFTPVSSASPPVQTSIIIEHSLGVVPSHVYVMAMNMSEASYKVYSVVDDKIVYDTVGEQDIGGITVIKDKKSITLNCYQEYGSYVCGFYNSVVYQWFVTE